MVYLSLHYIERIVHVMKELSYVFGVSSDL